MGSSGRPGQPEQADVARRVTNPEVIRMRTAWLLRRGWRATIVLGVLAGLAGGVAMAGWAIGRRASTSLDRLLADADPPDFIVNFCPPELDTIDDETLLQCFSYDAAAEVDEIRRLPEVAAAARGVYTGLAAWRPAQPGVTWPANGLVVVDSNHPGPGGEPLIVEGRRLADGAQHEVVVNETFADISGVGIGEEIDVTFWAPEETGDVLAPGSRFHGPRATVRVVGVVRGFRDLVASVGTQSSQLDEASMVGGPSLAATIVSAGRFGGVVVNSLGTDGSAIAAVERTFSNRMFNISTTFDDDETEPVAAAIRYEVRGALVFALVAGIAAAAFCGQAMARQARREWVDRPTLRALGLSDREAWASATLRGAVVGALAAVVAVVASIALTALGPFGVAGRAEIDPGVVVDGVVLATGAVLVLVVVIAAAWLPVARQFRHGRVVGRAGPIRGLGTVTSSLPPPMSVGARMTLGGGASGAGLSIGAAVGSVAIAVAAVLAAIGATASLDELTSNPDRFGAPWDLSFGGVSGGTERLAAAVDRLADHPDVAAAAGIEGNDAEIGDEVAWVYALVPVDGVDGVIAPVITSGRLPLAIDEIALGSATMADQGLSIGDSVEVRPTTSQHTEAIPMTVVGTTIVNDSYENSPGRGGVVTKAWISRFVPESSPDPYVVRLVEGADPSAMRAEVSDLFGGAVNGPQQQGAIRNVSRIRPLPVLLAGLVVVLAVASLAHALVLSVRRQRSQLAVLKSLGFQRRQVGSTVAAHATVVGLIAIVLGAPLGVIAGRWGWKLIADQLGVASGPVTPLVALATSVVGTIVVANLVAAYPAWRAARLPTAIALRVE